jgi:hypothetical protein
VLQSYHRFS